MLQYGLQSSILLLYHKCKMSSTKNIGQSVSFVLQNFCTTSRSNRRLFLWDNNTYMMCHLGHIVLHLTLLSPHFVCATFYSLTKLTCLLQVAQCMKAILILVKDTVYSSSTHTRHTTDFLQIVESSKLKKAQDKMWQQLSSFCIELIHISG